MYRIIVAIAALLIFMPVLADEAGETVTLMYVAQPDVTSHVHFTGETISVRDGVETVQMTMSGSQRVQTSAHPDGIVVRSDQHEFNFETEQSELKQYIDPALEMMSSIEVTSVVSDTGEFLKLEGMKPFLDSAKQSFNKMMETYPEEIKPMMNALLSATLTEEAMQRKARKGWEIGVTRWIGMELEKGKAYDLEYSESVPEFGGIELGFDAVYEFLGKVACNENDSAMSCAELSYQSSLKPASAELLAKAIGENMNLPSDIEFSMSLDTNFILIADPMTLRTHRLDESIHTTAPGHDGTGSVGSIQRMSMVYTYE